MSDVSQIIFGIWVGNEKSSQSNDFFELHNIKAVVNCTPDVPNKFEKNGVKYYRISVGDSKESQDQQIMQENIKKAVNFVNLHRKKGNVLIHCHMGIQRSCTIMAAYLKLIKNMNLQDCIKFMVSRRKQAFYGGTYLTFEEILNKI